VGNLACNVMHTLAAASTQPAYQPHSYYHVWGFVGVVLTAIVALLGFCYWLATAAHKDVTSAQGSLEQTTSAFFVNIILSEARRVFSIVDDHLPLHLSQEKSLEVKKSRFFMFCQTVRTIPEEQLDNRGKYTGIIVEQLGRIISDNASTLLDAMRATDASTQNQLLNPSGARFSLEGDGFLGFVFISKFDSDNRRLEWWFRQMWRLAVVVTGCAIACLGIALTLAFVNQKWAGTAINYSMIAFGIFIVLLATALVTSFCLKSGLITRARKFGDLAELDKFITSQKKRHAQKNF